MAGKRRLFATTQIRSSLWPKETTVRKRKRRSPRKRSPRLLPRPDGSDPGVPVSLSHRRPAIGPTSKSGGGAVGRVRAPGLRLLRVRRRPACRHEGLQAYLAEGFTPYARRSFSASPRLILLADHWPMTASNWSPTGSMTAQGLVPTVSLHSDSHLEAQQVR